MSDEKLKSEILSDPLARGYPAMSDTQVVSDMRDLNYMPVDVLAKDVRKYLMLQNVWASIADDAVNSTVDATRLACRALIDGLNAFEDFDLEDATILAVVSAQLAALVSANKISPTDKTVIENMGKNKISRETFLGFKVTLGGVQRVRV